MGLLLIVFENDIFLFWVKGKFFVFVLLFDSLIFFGLFLFWGYGYFDGLDIVNVLGFVFLIMFYCFYVKLDN